ncbi:23739_t:CDS:2, partial [Gigaspora margarita]
IAKQLALTNWYDFATTDAYRQLLIDKVIILALLFLLGHLLDTEVAKVIHKVDKILGHTSKFTIGLDGLTASNRLLIWNFVIITLLQQEYLYELENYSNQSYIAEFLDNQIKLIINCIGKNKISAIISDNRTHCFNLISKDIIWHIFAERMIQYANKLVGFFKKSHKTATILNQQILQYQVSSNGLKTYIETRWITVYECVSSIVQLKNCLEKI